jgi:hypothetical protein
VVQVIRFTVTDDGDDLVAVADDPRLRGVQWRWTPGTGQVEYGLEGHPVGTVNVWDYAAGQPDIEPSADALAATLEARYADVDEVRAVRAEVAMGGS